MGRMGAMGGGMGLQILNALHQALTRSAGAARQRHTTEGAQPAGSRGLRLVHCAFVSGEGTRGT